MINKSMNDEKSKNKDKKSKTQQAPNEQSGIYFSSHFKIFDPNTKEIFVRQRGD